MAKYQRFHTWAVLEKNRNKDGKRICYAVFNSRRDAINWLNYRKEEHFFSCGSMDEAEAKWGLDNFMFEETFTLTRSSMLENFNGIDLNTWNYDI